MKNPSVSVVIAAYHGEKFIGEQLQSLFRQTFLPTEILIGDDSSDDLTANTVRSVAAESLCPVKIIKNQSRLGCVQNFSNLAERAAGDIIFFCDQDDVWLPDKIEKMINEFQKHPGTAVVFCSSRFVDKNLNDMNLSTADILRVSISAVKKINENMDMKDFIRSPMMYGHNIAVRKNVLTGVLPIPARVKSYDLYLNYALSVQQIRCIPEDLTLFRRHENNFSEQAVFWKRVCNIISQKNNTELFDTWNQLDAALFMLENNKSSMSPEMLKRFRLLQCTRDFYRERMIFSSGNILHRLRCFLILKKYILYSFGIKSFARDIILGTKLSAEMKTSIQSENQ